MQNKQLENKLSSREVCKMMDLKQHSDLLRKIDSINEDFNQSNIAFVKYWAESTYIDAKGEERREFQITKKGCEFLAHKTTGTKGNLFTDRYMDKFTAMEECIEKGGQTYSYAIENPIERAKAWIKEQEEKQSLLLTSKKQEQIINELKPKADYTDTILKNKALVTITQIAKDYGISGQKLNKKLHDLKVQYKMRDQWLLYAKYQEKGYTHSETINVTHTNGMEESKMTTKWTQKGRLFLYVLLKEQGILPLIERR
ncbi:phage regulatory protein/antirepressor Ant [Clostridium sp. HBUAS56017]|uniref:phage regulatory protein/antirepressor Ant n=1 Tax=Clostridium sp. HBUAS56017 TaxID=2571128 RepID=UPI0011789D48|nr:phage regulatory protein/antirepressor Ant [Clostridium sp. HBUAS56017]